MIKNIIYLILFCFISIIAMHEQASAVTPNVCITPFTTVSRFKKVCPKVCRLCRLQIWKSKQSGHFDAGDPRVTSTSFITLQPQKPPTYSCLKAYDSSGRLIHQLGLYAVGGSTYSSRYYGGFGCGDHKRPRAIALLALRRTGKTAIYLKYNYRGCVKIPNPVRCYNSSSC